MWLKALKSHQQHEYTALPPQPSPPQRDRHDNVVVVIERRWTTPLRVAILALTGTVLAAAMFELGRRSTISPVWREVGLELAPRVFDGNETFIGKPTLARQDAWKSLMPEQGGFFAHPDLSTGRKSVFAVFHQLHCLEGLWKSWWLLYDTSKNGTKIVRAEMPHMLSPVHVNHCIELLRLTLMCRPDVTVEVAKPDTGGVTGFGTEHQCVSWERLLEWTREWEVEDT